MPTSRTLRYQDVNDYLFWYTTDSQSQEAQGLATALELTGRYQAGEIICAQREVKAPSDLSAE